VSFDPGTGRILQDVLKDNPWRMLVGCILLNMTTRTQVDKVRQQLFENYPGPGHMAVADPDELGELLKPLGLFRRRAVTLKRFSQDWLTVTQLGDRPFPTAWDVGQCYGIGKYATDSYRIFVLGEILKPRDVEDKVLKKYLEIAQERRGI
jgi:endonuclease III